MDDLGPEVDDPVMEYLLGLDPLNPRFPSRGDEEDPVPCDSRFPLEITRSTAVLLYQDPNTDDWLPLPTREDILSGEADPVSFENGSTVGVHGKLYDGINEPNSSYLDDTGIPDMTINISFDGALIPGGTITTGNASASIEPFGEYGNGTFEFMLDIEKTAGEYEVEAYFAGWPLTGQPVYRELSHKAIVYVSHPTLIDMDITPDTVTVGDPITISGSVADDTGRPITSVPLQVWFDDELVGPSSDGVYIDHVEVNGTNLSTSFEWNDTEVWTTYSVPGMPAGDQWERGHPGGGVGPMVPHHGSKLWCTDLDGNYERGAWSFLVSPSIDMSATRSYDLSFWAWWSMYWEDDMAYVLVSEDGGTTWDEANPMMFTDTGLVSSSWTQFEFDVTAYAGSDDVRLAFVFYSADKTTQARTDSTFSYQYVVPMDTEVGVHTVTVRFKGTLLFHEGSEQGSLHVKRKAHFEFESNQWLKVGYRNNPVNISARLVDNTGSVLRTNISGHLYFYQVSIYWDKTWVVEDGIGERVGPPRTMDSQTGNVSINYMVHSDQILGPVNVTFRFPGDDYYTPMEEATHYYVKAHTYIWVPPVQERQAFRGQNLDIFAELRIVPEESIDPIVPGDPLSGEFVKVFLDGDQIGNRRTTWAGNLSIDYLVPSTHPLADMLVTFVYDGQSLYEPTTRSVNYSVVSETFITLEDQTVYKGDWIWINGSIKDDKAQPVPNMPISIEWRGAAEIGRPLSTANGSFSLQHFIAFEDKRGNVSIVARFAGNKLYLATSTAATCTVLAPTTLVRLDTVTSVVRGDQIQISARLREDWGGQPGVEVQREIVTLIIDEIVVSYKRTAFDGSVTFTAPIESDKFINGEVDVLLVFGGTTFYEPSRNTTRLVIRANSILTFAEFRVNGELFDPTLEIVLKDDETYGRILLQDDNFQPIRYGNVSFYYKDEGEGARKYLVARGITDSQGFFAFNWTFKVNTVGTKTYIVEYEGLKIDTFVKEGDLIILPATVEYNITYDVPYVDPIDAKIDTTGKKRVGPGEMLRLEVNLRDTSLWDLDRLTITLESAPEGMTLSPNGTIEWTPTPDQVGQHTIRLRISDGWHSDTVTIDVMVAEDDSTPSERIDILYMILIGVTVAVLVVVVFLLRSRR